MFFGTVLALLSCGGKQATAASDNAAAVVDVIVTSGVPQPPPKAVVVNVGSSVIVRVEGLGQPRATVLGPDGARVTTADAPFVRDGKIGGTQHQFTPQAAGTYRVELSEVQGLELARVTAKSLP